MTQSILFWSQQFIMDFDAKLGTRNVASQNLHFGHMIKGGLISESITL